MEEDRSRDEITGSAAERISETAVAEELVVEVDAGRKGIPMEIGLGPRQEVWRGRPFSLTDRGVAPERVETIPTAAGQRLWAERPRQDFVDRLLDNGDFIACPSLRLTPLAKTRILVTIAFFEPEAAMAFYRQYLR